MNSKKMDSKTIRQAAWVVCLIVFSAAVGRISFGKGFDFDTIHSIRGDGFWNLEFLKSIQENGFLGAWFNPRTGAPGITTQIDFPGTSYFDILIFWILSLFINSTPRIAYTFEILSFVLDALAMWFLLKRLGFHNVVSFVVSSLFAFAPYHFFRSLGHNSLIVYIYIPLSIYLGCYIIGIISEKKRWKPVLAAVLVGIGYGYYYAFGLIVLALAYFVGFIKLDNKKELLSKWWILALILGIIFAGLLPKTIYGWIHGANTEMGQRSYIEQEIYGLKIIQLLLPPTYSRIPFFRKVAGTYSMYAPLVNENATASMGVIASCGFMAMCAAFVVSFAMGKKTREGRWPLIDYISLLTIAFLLTGAIGGFGEIFNMLVTPQIRCYNRASILISCLSLIMFAVLLEQCGKKKPWLYLICGCVLLGGCYDQVVIREENWQQPALDVQRAYEAYFSRLEEQLPEGAAVFELPNMEFPEAGPTEGVADYQLFAGYYFTDSLRWSYGAVRGRDEDNRALNIDDGIGYRFLKAIKDAGFSAVFIDLDGYRAEDAAQILRFYNSMGIAPIVSDDQKLYAYDISALEITEEMIEKTYQQFAPCVEPGIPCYFDNTLRDIQHFFTEGMSATENDFAWLDGDRAVFQTWVNEYTDYELTLWFRAVYAAPQTVQVYAGDRLLISKTIMTGQDLLVIPIPAECVENHVLSLRFDLPDAVSPLEREDSEDPRELSLAISALMLDYARDFPAAMTPAA